MALAGGSGIGQAYTNYGLRTQELAEDKKARQQRQKLALLGLGASALNNIAQTGSGIYDTISRAQTAQTLQQNRQKHETMLDEIKGRREAAHDALQYPQIEGPVGAGGIGPRRQIPFQQYAAESDRMRAEAAMKESERAPFGHELAQALIAPRVGTVADSERFLGSEPEGVRNQIIESMLAGKSTPATQHLDYLREAERIAGPKQFDLAGGTDIEAKRQAMAVIIANLQAQNASPEMLNAVMSRFRSVEGVPPQSMEPPMNVENFFRKGIHGIPGLGGMVQSPEERRRIQEELLDAIRTGKLNPQTPQQRQLYVR